MLGMSGEDVFGLAIVLFVCGVFSWVAWVTSPKHPERMERLSKNFEPLPNAQDTD